MTKLDKFERIYELHRIFRSRAFETLATLGYRPLVPITAGQFADAELRGSPMRCAAISRRAWACGSFLCGP